MCKRCQCRKGPGLFDLDLVDLDLELLGAYYICLFSIPAGGVEPRTYLGLLKHFGLVFENPVHIIAIAIVRLAMATGLKLTSRIEWICL